MYSATAAYRKAHRRVALVLMAILLAACNVSLPGNSSGPQLGAGAVRVGLLVPYGSAAAGDDLVARSIWKTPPVWRQARHDRSRQVEITVYQHRRVTPAQCRQPD